MTAKIATNEGLEAAARALDAMANGAVAAHADIVSGALAMDTLLMRDPDASASRAICAMRN